MIEYELRTKGTGRVVFRHRNSENSWRLTLEKACKFGSSLINLNLSGCWLYGAQLQNTNFSGTNFRGANLKLVNFSHCNLSGCEFDGADLEGVDFTGAKVGTVIWGNAKIDPAWVLGPNCTLYRPPYPTPVPAAEHIVSPEGCGYRLNPAMAPLLGLTPYARESKSDFADRLFAYYRNKDNKKEYTVANGNSLRVRYADGQNPQFQTPFGDWMDIVDHKKAVELLIDELALAYERNIWSANAEL